MWLIRNDQHIICSDPLEEYRSSKKVGNPLKSRKSVLRAPQGTVLARTIPPKSSIAHVQDTDFQAPYASLWIVFTHNMNPNPCSDSLVTLTVWWSRNLFTWYDTITERRRLLQLEAASQTSLFSTRFSAQRNSVLYLKSHNHNGHASFWVLESMSISPADMESGE